MALTAAEKQQLERLEAKKAAPADDGEEESAWVRLEDGREVRLTGERLRRFMAANGFDAEDVDDATQGDPLVAKGTGPAGRPAKKGAPKKAAPADDADGDGAELEELTPEPGPRRQPRFF